MPNFASDDDVVMKNPYLQSRVAVWGSKAVLGPRDTRPIVGPWQREKSVKMMKSLTGERRVFGTLVIPAASLLFIVLKPRFKRAATAARPPNRRPWLPLTSLWPSHISAKPKSMVIARISLRFWPLNLGLLYSHSFDGWSPIWGWPAPRHDELIGNQMDYRTAALPTAKTGIWYDWRARPQVFRFRQ
ncbi:MAG TPA: hypothetical protein VE111_10735 [Bradyrhizobium sp.]|nr:hypothetical protein [Bradyrhizobium sp.]